VLVSTGVDAEGVGGTDAVRSVTPKALANYSPGLERSDNPGVLREIRI